MPVADEATLWTCQSVIVDYPRKTSRSQHFK